MELMIRKAGMLTSVQDLGRWGYQSSGVPVAGAMDLTALRLGNTMLGNPENAAALEVTFIGPEIEVIGEGAAVFAGADLGFSVNGTTIGSWNSVVLKNGDVIAFKGPRKNGCRGNLCFTGGIDVPLVMGSRSTCMRAGIGGLGGRVIKGGDVLKVGEHPPLWSRQDGFNLPAGSDLMPDPGAPLSLILGLQEDAFKKEGKNLLFESEYLITSESDRMGCRLSGPAIAHNEKGADIVSDVIPLGAVQIPGDGMPIIMLADRQTTGGYTKIGVLTPLSVSALVQKIPGSRVRFRCADVTEGISEHRKIREAVAEVRRLRASHVSRAGTTAVVKPVPDALTSRFKLTVDGRVYDISCEEIL